MQITIQSTEEVWRDGAGRRVIYDVLTTDGTVYKTFSNNIGQATPGTTMAVVAYQKKSGRTMETFIKKEQYEDTPEGKASNGNGGSSNGNGGQAHGGHVGAGSRSKKVYDPAYSVEEYEALFRHAYDFVVDMVMPPDGSGLDEKIEVSPLVSTYIIGAQRMGMKVSPPAPPLTPDQLTLEHIDGTLEKAGLLEGVIEAEIPQEILLEWYESKGRKDKAFIELVKVKLTGGSHAE